jgi:hypothetical protein
VKQTYIERNFKFDSLKLIIVINDICKNYAEQGFTLTVRQLYYQLVARNIIPNNERSYKNTTSLVNDARLAGLVDWDAIEDRTRAFINRPRWGDGADFLTSVAPQYHSDPWDSQADRVFVIVEKEALVGVLQGVCHEYDVPLLAARGYPSVSVLREFAQSEIIPREGSQYIHILHLGDHDPSGIDMTRDLIERLTILCAGDWAFDLKRIALNMDQIEAYGCPPNPAKLSDSRSDKYVTRFGTDSWELDALEPAYLVNLVRENIEAHLDFVKWELRLKEIASIRADLVELAKGFK